MTTQARSWTIGMAVAGAVLLAAPLAQQRVEPRAISGGTFEASGVAPVAGTSGVLFVDDSRTREVFWMALGPDGMQRGDVAAIPLGADIEDPEGIATDGTHFYIVGSQSKGRGPDGPGLARFTFDATQRRATGVETIDRLKAWLVEHVPELEGIDAARATDEFNIEGLAVDPGGKRLLLGFRAPLVDGQALIVPLSLRDPKGRFAADNLAVTERAMRVPIRGGIRSLDYDAHAKSLLILVEGATGDSSNGAFQLVEWNEQAQKTRTIASFDNSQQPEGVTRISGGGASGLVVMFDTSRYALIK